jgi:hypothetical protein
MSISVTFGLVHALYGRLLGPIASAAYVALSHTLWAITIAWILLACTAGHGGIFFSSMCNLQILDKYIFLNSLIFHEFSFCFQIFKVTGSIFY